MGEMMGTGFLWTRMVRNWVGWWVVLPQNPSHLWTFKHSATGERSSCLSRVQCRLGSAPMHGPHGQTPHHSPSSRPRLAETRKRCQCLGPLKCLRQPVSINQWTAVRSLQGTSSAVASCSVVDFVLESRVHTGIWDGYLPTVKGRNNTHCRGGRCMLGIAHSKVRHGQ